MIIEIGDVFYLYGQKNHVVAEVDDHKFSLIVLKAWSGRKQRWDYKVEPKWVIEEFAKRKVSK